jgi:protein-tyrosine phosphatase
MNALECSKEDRGLAEISRVWERLFVGGRTDAERLYLANPYDITTVISLCERPVICLNPFIVYLHIPIGDRYPLSAGQFDTVIKAIADNIRRGTVLIHCGSGVCRTPIMAAAWMHITGYKDIDTALMEVAGVRPIIDPSDILLKSVKQILRNGENRTVVPGMLLA